MHKNHPKISSSCLTLIANQSRESYSTLWKQEVCNFYFVTFCWIHPWKFRDFFSMFVHPWKFWVLSTVLFSIHSTLQFSGAGGLTCLALGWDCAPNMLWTGWKVQQHHPRWLPSNRCCCEIGASHWMESAAGVDQIFRDCNMQPWKQTEVWPKRTKTLNKDFVFNKTVS